jgi:outer membrane lipopolysaccharide assembly protein LptE/RlpB
MLMKKPFNFYLLISFLFVSGCGYQFRGSGTVLPDDVRKVYLAPIENDTTESTLTRRLSEAFRDEFERYGVVQVVDSQSEADAIFSAKIKDYQERVRNVSGANDTALGQELSVTISAELKRKTGQVLWRDTNLKQIQAYAGVGDLVVTSSSAFAQGNINISNLNTLSVNEVARGQRSQAEEDMITQISQEVYQNAIAADF